MKLLILGGTKFLGRHLVGAALARGDEVTLFNRGLHNTEIFPEVEKLRGERDGGLDALRGRRWDAVVDTSGYVPRVVRASAELLADSVGKKLRRSAHDARRSEEHTSELQSHSDLVCRLLPETKNDHR